MRSIFSIGIGILYAAYTIVRVAVESSAASRARAAADPAEEARRRRDAMELALLTGGEIIILGLFMARLPLIEAFAFDLHWIIRAAGLCLSALGVTLIAWASRVLDGEYSSVVEFKTDHHLVTTGPYARIRHPIYAGPGLLNLGVPLASANALIALVWIAGLGLVLARRIPREEARLRERFGSEWKKYAARTGRFFPRRKAHIR
jgi:protein-S-isoprenylcysteine O-methyltransferase Ste14